MQTDSEEESVRDKPWEPMIIGNGSSSLARSLRSSRRPPNLLTGIVLVASLTLLTLLVFKEKVPDYILEPGSEELAAPINLTESVRVLCYMQTTPSTAETKAIHGKNTWGRRCNKLLLMSSQVNEKAGTIGLNAGEGRNNLANKTFEAFQYLYEHHLNEYDWFMKMDDDTYVIVENLRYFLYQYSPDFPIFFGSKLIFANQIYFSGGSGYVLSREALRRFVEVAVKSPNNCTSKTDHEDVQLGRCLQYANVTAADSRGINKRALFLPDKPEFFFEFDQAKNAKKWFTGMSYYEAEYGPDNCCSDMAISFHYISPVYMYILEYFIYQLQPYGMQYAVPELLPKKSWEEASYLPPGKKSLSKSKSMPTEANHQMDVDKMVASVGSIGGTKMDSLIDQLLKNSDFKNKISKKLKP